MEKRITDPLAYERWLLKESENCHHSTDAWMARTLARACLKLLVQQHDAAIRAARRSKSKRTGEPATGKDKP